MHEQRIEPPPPRTKRDTNELGYSCRLDPPAQIYSSPPPLIIGVVPCSGAQLTAPALRNDERDSKGLRWTAIQLRRERLATCEVG